MGSAYNRVIETRKELTKQLLAEMEQGELPWMKGWKTTGTRPYNPVTKAVYKGNNRLRLMLASHFGQFQDNRWVTFNQAKDKGWKIKSGEKGTLCEKWIFEEKKVIEDPVTGEKETVYEELEHPKVNYFILFNADQVDGIPEKEKKEPLSRDEQLALADQFVKSSVCSVIEGANETEAYYSPARDEIHLPARDYFYSAGEFLGTAIHEMFYPQLGVKLCSMAGGGVQKIYMVFLREPSRRDNSGSDLFHLWDRFEIKMNFDRNVSCFIFVNAFMHNDFFD